MPRKMEVFEAIKKRRSIRKFNPQKKVTDEQIEKLLEAARWAPSAGNLQSRFLVVVQDQKIKNKLMLAALGQAWVAKAPVVIVACADLKRVRLYGLRGKELYAIQDATLSTQSLWLKATEMGLGAVWVGAFNERLVKKILKLENHLKPVVILPIGYPANIPSATPRRPIKEISKKL